MNNIFLTISFLFFCLIGNAQTGIGTTTPNASANNTTRFATSVTFILTDLAPGTCTFKLQVSREAEVGSIKALNNYHVSGTAQVFVK